MTYKQKGFPMHAGVSPVKHEDNRPHKHNEDGTIGWLLRRSDLGKPTYREAWDMKDQENKDKYGSFKNFVEAAKKWNEEQDLTAEEIEVNRE